MHNNRSVTVIIPTYNRAEFITKAIESALKQTMPVHEIIVVDDGSKDNTKVVLEKYQNKIKYIYQSNAGPAAARNRGIKTATGEWLAFLDSDDRWLPTKLESQLSETIRLDGNISFHDLSIHETGTNICHSWNERVHDGNNNVMPLKTGILKNAYQYLMSIGHLFLTTTLIVKKSTLLSVGLFREDLRTSEDLELYFRLAVRWPIAYIAEPLAIYSPGPERVTNKEKLYSDRITAILISMTECVKSRDTEKSLIAKAGLLQHIKSLAGVYRREGRWLLSIYAYSNYLIGIAKTPENIIAEYRKNNYSQVT
jgi:glycosyltransferase involved in cell wall biosynthesis